MLISNSREATRDGFWASATLLCAAVLMMYSLLTFQMYETLATRIVASSLSALAVIVLVRSVRVPAGGNPCASEADTEKAPLWSPTLLLALGSCAIVFVSICYAYTPSQAFDYAIKYAVAFSVCVLVYIAAQDGRVLRRMLWLMALLLAVNMLLGIEAASTRMLATPFTDHIAEIDPEAAENYGFWSGTRMMTLLNANVSAALGVIGSFIVYYLLRTSETRLGKSLSSGAAPLMMMGFFLCASVGATLCAIATAIFAVLSAGKDNRAGFALYLIGSAFIGALCAGAAFFGMGSAFPRSLLPLAAAAVCVFCGVRAGSAYLTMDGGRVNKTLAAVCVAWAVLVAAVVFTTPQFYFSRIGDAASSGTAAERLIFYKDAWIIAQDRILTGWGAGAFEAKFVQVQATFIESKYVHSHYLQTLVETGIVGLGLYIAAAARAFVVLCRVVRSDAENRPLAWTLLCALVMVTLHSAVDFDMSFEWFLAFVFALFGITAAVFDRKVLRKNTGKKRKFRNAAVCACVSALPVIVIAMCVGTGIAANEAEKLLETEGEVTIVELAKSMETAAAADPTHALDYKSAYLDIVAGEDLPQRYHALARAWASDLAEYTDRSVSACRTLAQYYYADGAFDKAVSFIVKIPGVRPKDSAGKEEAVALLNEVAEGGNAARKAVARGMETLGRP